MRGMEPMCSRENGSCPLILKPDPTADMEGHFAVLVTKVPGCWNGGISRKEKCRSASGARRQVMAMGYIEGRAKIKRRLASEPWEAKRGRSLCSKSRPPTVEEGN
jgi:hypothetical protein